MASLSSSTSARGRRRAAFLRQPSRKGDYEGPARHCHHKLVAPQWTVWTDINPSRRFYGCCTITRKIGVVISLGTIENWGRELTLLKSFWMILIDYMTKILC